MSLKDVPWRFKEVMKGIGWALRDLWTGAVDKVRSQRWPRS